MLDVDRRSFIAVMGMSTLPVALGESSSTRTPRANLGDLLYSQLGFSAGTAQAMASRARRFVGESDAVLTGSSDGRRFELSRSPKSGGTWLLQGSSENEVVLADAIGFACERAADQLNRLTMSFRWFSGCSFGGATAHLFRANKSALFLVTRAIPVDTIAAKRLDIIMV